MRESVRDEPGTPEAPGTPRSELQASSDADPSPSARERSALPRRLVALGVLSAVAIGVGRLATRREGTAGSSASTGSSSATAGSPRPSSPSLLAPTPSGSGGALPSPSGSPEATSIDLPRGGRQIFPRYRLVGFCGLPGSAALGRLGIGRLDDRVTEIEKLARQYRAGREALPVLELIGVIVQPFPGRDGLYRDRTADDVVAEHLAAARRHRALLLLNIQPGRARFLDEVRALEHWLREPEVGIALDPEWAIGPGETPGRVFGSTTGAVVDSVAAYLDGLVTAGNLPQKVLVVHQLNPQIVTGWEALERRPGVVVVKSVDGIGPAGAKITTWKRLVKGLPRTLHPGFKLFFDEDRRGGQSLMSASQVLALHPQPEYVMYE
jgi:hypothetical protein